MEQVNKLELAAELMEIQQNITDAQQKYIEFLQKYPFLLTGVENTTEHPV